MGIEGKKIESPPNEKPFQTEKILLTFQVKKNLEGVDEAFRQKQSFNIWSKQNEVLKKSFSYPKEGEKELSHGEKRIIFKENYKRFTRTAKMERSNQFLIGSIYYGLDMKDPDKKELIKRLKEVRKLLEDYKLQKPEDILSAKSEAIKQFAAEFSLIVDKPASDLIREWVSLRNEELDWDKLSSLLDDQTVGEEIFNKVTNGEDLDISELFLRHSNLTEEQDQKQKELAEKMSELTLPVQSSEGSESYLSTLPPEGQQQLILILRDTGTSEALFDEVVNFLDTEIKPESFDVKSGNLSFSIYSPKGLQIDLSLEGSEIVLEDGGQEIRLKIGDKEEYQLERQIFDIKNILKVMETRGEVVLPKQLKKFFYSRNLAKFIHFIAIYRPSIAGYRNEGVLFEARKVYEHLLRQKPDKLFRLSRDLEKAKDDKEIREIALREEKSIN